MAALGIELLLQLKYNQLGWKGESMAVYQLSQGYHSGHLAPVRMATVKKKKVPVGESAEEREPLCTVGGNANWFNPYGKRHGSSLKN